MKAEKFVHISGDAQMGEAGCRVQLVTDHDENTITLVVEDLINEGVVTLNRAQARALAEQLILFAVERKP